MPTPVVVSINAGEAKNNTVTILKAKCEMLLLNYPELTKIPDYTAQRKHNHYLEIIVDNYKPRMIKVKTSLMSQWEVSMEQRSVN